MHLHTLLLPTVLLPLIHAAVSTITLTQSASPLPTSSSYTSTTNFRNSLLAAHNFYRLEHNVSALTWNDTSASYASNWANPCVFKHSGGPTGENLAAGYANASAAVDAWGLEREEYDWNKPGFSEETGHFTQVVWGNSSSVGCGLQSCLGKNKTPGFYIVCEYYPAGNIVGNNNQYFRDNVKKQVVGKKTDTLESGVDGKGSSEHNEISSSTSVTARSTTSTFSLHSTTEIFTESLIGTTTTASPTPTGSKSEGEIRASVAKWVVLLSFLRFFL